jgi:hypothetical protein
MPLTGEAKTAYQREYMKRRRAAQQKPETKEADDPNRRYVSLVDQMAYALSGLRVPPEEQEADYNLVRKFIARCFVWTMNAGDETIQAMHDEMLEDCERWAKETAEEERSAAGG